MKLSDIDVELSDKTEDFENITCLSSEMAPAFKSRYIPKKTGINPNVTYEECKENPILLESILNDF